MATKLSKPAAVTTGAKVESPVDEIAGPDAMAVRSDGDSRRRSHDVWGPRSRHRTVVGPVCMAIQSGAPDATS